jgi:hypothetical protein
MEMAEMSLESLEWPRDREKAESVPGNGLISALFGRLVGRREIVAGYEPAVSGVDSWAGSFSTSSPMSK